MNLRFALLLLLVLPVSCRHVAKSVRQPLDAAGTKFASIAPGMKQPALVKILGQPDHREGRKSAVWEKRHDAVNYELTTVNFNPARRVGDIEWESSRGNAQGISQWRSRTLWKASEGHPRWLWKRTCKKSWMIPIFKGEQHSSSTYFDPVAATAL